MAALFSKCVLSLPHYDAPGRVNILPSLRIPHSQGIRSCLLLLTTNHVSTETETMLFTTVSIMSSRAYVAQEVMVANLDARSWRWQLCSTKFPTVYQP